jgi:hypothetical protein
MRHRGMEKGRGEEARGERAYQPPSLSLLGLPGRTGGRGRQQRGSPKENSEFARYSIRSDLKINYLRSALGFT